MDPLTQATVGAAAAALVCRRSETRHALVLGALAGAVPDLDVLIRSESDPLLALEYHRHFTHSLFLAPLIGLLVAVLFKWLFFWKDWQFARLALFGVLGAGTHGLIDACTSYGTMLYWPWNHARVSWDIISIIDPIFTLPLCLLVLCAFVWRRPRFVQFGLGFCLLYLSMGLYQRHEAVRFAEQLAEARGHEHVEAMTARPSLGNIALWRIVYRFEGQYFVDAVRTLPFLEPRHYPGSEVDAFSEAHAGEWAPEGSVLATDIERFRFFSQGYLYQSPEDSAVLGDLRYAMYPDSIQPLWGIRSDLARPDEHARLEYFRDPSQRAFGRLWAMICGEPLEPLAPLQ